MSWGIDHGCDVDDGTDLELIYFGEHLDYFAIQVTYLVILFVVFVYLIRNGLENGTKNYRMTLSKKC